MGSDAEGTWQKLNTGDDGELVFATHFWADDYVQPGQRYEFKVEATSFAGLRSNSNCQSDVFELGQWPREKPPTVRSAPQISVIGDDSVSVSWEMAAGGDDGPGSADSSSSYVIQYRSEGRSVWNQTTARCSPAFVDDLKARSPIRRSLLYLYD